MRFRGYVSVRGLAIVALALTIVAAGVVAYSVRRTISLRSQRPAAPKGIIALSPALTDLLFQMGAGDQVIGVAGYSHLPPGQSRPIVGDYLRGGREQILRLRPAVVVTQFDNELLRQLERDEHIRVERMPIETLADIRRALLELDRIAGGDGGAKLTRQIDRQL
ncbi:MAG: hypothetical protein PHU85_19940, partial [Phycisphaerae bacterium]|nr:hypothetical protein [Phycisphaerae bacterium]